VLLDHSFILRDLLRLRKESEQSDSCGLRLRTGGVCGCSLVLESGVLGLGLGFRGFWLFFCVCVFGRGSVVLEGVRGLV
jgi:hypothetical protein